MHACVKISCRFIVQSDENVYCLPSNTEHDANMRPNRLFPISLSTSGTHDSNAGYRGRTTDRGSASQTPCSRHRHSVTPKTPGIQKTKTIYIRTVLQTYRVKGEHYMNRYASQPIRLSKLKKNHTHTHTHRRKQAQKKRPVPCPQQKHRDTAKIYRSDQPDERD